MIQIYIQRYSRFLLLHNYIYITILLLNNIVFSVFIYSVERGKLVGGRPPCPHSNSRDVSGVVTYAEVLLEIHGLVGGAELKEQRDTRSEGGEQSRCFVLQAVC